MSDAPSASDPREVAERLRAIAGRVAKADQGPWEAVWLGECLISPHVRQIKRHGGRYTIATPVHSNDSTMRNMEFIAAAREDVPWLLSFAEQWAALDAPVIGRIRARGGLAAYVRDLEGARERAEQALATAQFGWRQVQPALDASRERLRDLEAALQRLAGHHHAVTHQERFETCETAICREAREALSPPGPTQGAPAAEPARADDDPRGA